MKDKKFLVLCGLGVVWLVLLLGMFTETFRVNRNVELCVTFCAIAWFAYWTLSTVRWAKKPEPKPESEAPNAAPPKETKSK